MLFDTHAHMDDRAFDEDREVLLARLPEQGIGLLMNPGCSLASSRDAVALAARYDYIYAAVGSHPDAADEVTPAVLDEYRMLCKQNPKVAPSVRSGWTTTMRMSQGSVSRRPFGPRWGWRRSLPCR